MQIGPISITLNKPASRAPSGRGWFPLAVREPFTGAWQQNQEITGGDVSRHPIVFACQTLIAGDIGKMSLGLVEFDRDTGIWAQTESPAYSPVLRRPNRYQIRQKFIEQWMLSKLSWGNAYILKRRDARNIPVELFVLNPARVKPLVSDESGSVFYEIDASGHGLLGSASWAASTITVPAREVIHDVMVPLYHPLVGVSPIYACAVAAGQGLRIMDNSTAFFANGSMPSGVLTAPGPIPEAIAADRKAYWEKNFTGANAGRLAVLGDGMKYEPMTINPVDAALIDQLNWSDARICSTYHVPAYKVGVGPDPNYNNITALDLQYYAQCLQGLIESIEALLDDGLEVPRPLGTEFNLDDLLRMDPLTLIDVETKAVGGGIKSPNEARRRLNLPPVPGGDTPYMQSQNESLAALARRDEAPPAPALPPADEAPDAGDEPDDDDALTSKLLAALVRKAATPVVAEA